MLNSQHISKKKESFIKKLRSAAILPAITLLFALCIIAGIFLFVVPQLEPVLSSIKEKPLGTIFLLRASNFLRSETHRIQIVIALSALLFSWRATKKFGKKSEVVDKLFLHIPFIGSTIILKNTIHVLQTLSLLLKSGTPLPKSFVLASKVCTNQAIQKDFLDVAQKLEKGKSLSQACESIKNNYIGPLALGQASGTLDQMLEKASQLLEEKLDKKMDALTKIFQPILLIGLGLFIAFVMLSIYLPLFDTAHIFS